MPCAGQGKCVFVACGTANATHAMVGAFPFELRCSPWPVCCATGLLLRSASVRQTLRACSETRRGYFWYLLCFASWIAKRYVCAPRVLPTVKVCDDSSALTHWRPPNVTHVMVFVRSGGVQETFKNQLNIKLFVAWRTSLSCPGRQTCVGVRPGDFVCLWHTMKNISVSNNVSKCKLRCFADRRRSPNMRGCNV